MKEIDVTTLKEKIDRQQALQLIDVREPWELEICCLEPAINLPMSEITQRVDEVKPNIETIVICHHGGRSMQVALWLEQQGLGEMTNLQGGIDAWATCIDPTLARY